MIFKVNDITIIILEDVICELNKYYSDNAKEVGGILLGRFVGKTMYEITEIACISSKYSTKMHYQRDAKKAQSIINKRWSETGGEINYLGEWHTHPGMSPTPSAIDVRSLFVITEQVGHVLSVVVLIILGTNKKTSVNVSSRKERVNYACIFDR